MSLPSLGTLAPLLLGLMACTGWPTYDNLPEVGGVVPADADPRAGVEIDWLVSDTTPAAMPPGEDLPLVTLGTGVRLSGTLDGIGWHDLATPVEQTSDACASVGRRTPALEGDWVADVQVFRLGTRGEGRLCVTFTGGTGQQGFDVLLWQLDACGIPAALVEGDDGPVGLGAAGPYLDYSVPVDGERDLSLLVAGYAPNRLEEQIDYAVTVSMVTDGTLCPAAGVP